MCSSDLVYCDYREKTGDSKPVLLASTASAYKFAESVGKAIGIDEELNGFDFIKKINEMTGLAVPKGLKDLDRKKDTNYVAVGYTTKLIRIICSFDYGIVLIFSIFKPKTCRRLYDSDYFLLISVYKSFR